MKQSLPYQPGPIGVFDSGYGGLTILSKIREALPEYDYIYLGDNAPIGPGWYGRDCFIMGIWLKSYELQVTSHNAFCMVLVACSS